MKKITAPLVIEFLEPQVFNDERGYFIAVWHSPRYFATGIAGDFVQNNLPSSTHCVLRGLHYHYPNPQGILIFAIMGYIYDVAVECRCLSYIQVDLVEEKSELTCKINAEAPGVLAELP